MSLATRCSACGTVFRVVQDQLKVSEGWVRCGRCKEVFNALEALFDLEREAPPQWKPPAPADAAVDAAPAASDGATSEPVDRGAAQAVPDAALPSIHGSLDGWPDGERAFDEATARTDTGVAGSASLDAAQGAPTSDGTPHAEVTAPVDATSNDMPSVTGPDGYDAPTHDADAPSLSPSAVGESADTIAADGDASHGVGAAPRHPPDAAVSATTSTPRPPGDDDSTIDDDPREFADARFDSRLALEDDGTEAAPADARADAAVTAEPDGPAFLHDTAARRRERPAVRALLAVAAVGLAVALAAQATLQWRDEMAARWPGSRPYLALACEALGCEIGALRRIDEISVESSALTLAAPGQSDAMRLTVALRNGGAVPLQAPMIDLTLTDGNGDIVSRRALRTADFRHADAVLAPGTETQLELLLSTGGQRVTGYTVEIFYP